ncbi:ABC transporter permease subunit [Halobacillus amylolyticus]|uniref:ABC transporter permease subunit n=1 Tax=Halobacillus amylolyticus TaxID=2932259 RepID=A0ABY4H947_9BACI|nr:ABC transporter permease subunit [Halobacillus amylolyticus]UOR10963.1 ABC transporter permease subunit [Halobacillus amylolyticus]
MKLLKNKSFMVGFLFIFLMVLGSLMYGWLFDNAIPTAELRYTEDGVKRPPYSPAEYPPFGTNNMAQSLFHIILIGAKYTLGIAFGIAILRFTFATMIGTLSEVYLPRLTAKLQHFLEGFYYFPVTLISFLVLEWILFQDGFDGPNRDFTYSFETRIIFELVVLVIVALPITSTLIAKEVKQIRQMEFMDSVQILGGSRFHIIKKHIYPFLKPQLVVILLREVIQVLILLAHLGILGIFFGGGQMAVDIFDNSIFVSLSNEWSGLIGENYTFLFTPFWWIALVPIIMLTLAVLAVKLMLEGYQRVINSKEKRETKKQSEQEINVTDETLFKRVSNNR